jgi:hypothetical protein
MQSTQAPAKASGVTAKKMNVEFGSSGSHFKHKVTVPAGTRCIKIDDSSMPWVVDDLSFIEDKQSLLFSEADVFGVRFADKDITDIRNSDNATA